MGSKSSIICAKSRTKNISLKKVSNIFVFKLKTLQFLFESTSFVKCIFNRVFLKNFISVMSNNPLFNFIAYQKFYFKRPKGKQHRYFQFRFVKVNFWPLIWVTSDKTERLSTFQFSPNKFTTNWVTRKHRHIRFQNMLITPVFDPYFTANIKILSRLN